LLRYNAFWHYLTCSIGVFKYVGKPLM
jgi:hypothetical protein